MQRRGFSLVETLVTSAILAVIAGAVAGVMSVAVRASGVEDPKRHDDLLSARISEEISSAVEVLAIGPGAIRFSVADRDGDVRPEVIEYFWSGRRGDPLTRRVNEAPFEHVIDQVSFFAASAVAARRSEADGSAFEVDTERLLARNRKSDATEVTIDRGSHIEYRIQPTFGEDVTAWRPTSLKLKLAAEGEPDGRFNVSVYRGNPGGRSGERLVSVSFAERSLNETASDIVIPLHGIAALDPSQVIVISIEDADQSQSVRVALHRQGIADRNGLLRLGNVDEVNEREYPSGALVYELTGVVTVDRAGERAILRGRSVEITLATDEMSRTTTIPLFAHPLVPEGEFVREDDRPVQDGRFATEEGE